MPSLALGCSHLVRGSGARGGVFYHGRACQAHSLGFLSLLTACTLSLCSSSLLALGRRIRGVAADQFRTFESQVLCCYPVVTTPLQVATFSSAEAVQLRFAD